MEEKLLDADLLWEDVGWVKCRKKPIVVKAVQINEPFRVTTHEGELRGKAGDWLMMGVRGEKYPISDAIFRETYDILIDEGVTINETETTTDAPVEPDSTDGG